MRFSEFKNEWKQTFLKEIAEKVNTKNNDEKIDLVFSNSAVQGIVLQNDYFDKSIANKNNLNGYYVVKPLDFVYNPRISASAEVGAMNVNKTNETGLVSPLYTVFRLKSDNIENPFLEFLFKSKVWHNYMRSIANYGARDDRMNVKNEDFFEMPLLIPEITEQKKIVNFLSSVENKIQTQRKTIEELNAFKKGIAKKIFSQQLRFKDDSGNYFPEWESKMLGEVLDYEQPTKYLVSTTEYDDSFKTPVVTAGKTFILGYTNEEENIFEKEKLPVIIFDDFTTASQFVDFPFKAKSSAMKILKAQKGNDVKFIFEAMQMISYEIGGHGRHWISVFSNLEISLPTLSEQQKVASFLSSIDTKIDIENQILQKLEEQKKYFLANLFI